MLRQHPGTDRAILALVVRTPHKWEVMGAWELACSGPEPVALGGFADRLRERLHSRSVDTFVGQMDESQRSCSAMQPRHVLWRGPEDPLLMEHRCHGGFQGKVVI